MHHCLLTSVHYDVLVVRLHINRWFHGNIFSRWQQDVLVLLFDPGVKHMVQLGHTVAFCYQFRLFHVLHFTSSDLVRHSPRIISHRQRRARITGEEGADCDLLWISLTLIPRLHDEASSTSWLDERSSSPLVERSSSARQALVELAWQALHDEASFMNASWVLREASSWS